MERRLLYRWYGNECSDNHAFPIAHQKPLFPEKSLPVAVQNPAELEYLEAQLTELDMKICKTKVILRELFNDQNNPSISEREYLENEIDIEEKEEELKVLNAEIAILRARILALHK